MLTKLIDRMSDASGTAISASVAICLILGATIAGYAFDFSRTWERVVVVGSALVTLLIVVAIQHTQSKETKATHIKLDELLRAVGSASNEVRGIERESHDELDRIRETHDVEGEGFTPSGSRQAR
jgi:low affinity Fe/Cu permease